MNRVVLAAVFVLAIGGAGVSAGVASADNGATTTHFTTAYTDPTLGHVTCSGERITKTGPKAFIKDSETCLIGNGFPAGTYTTADFGPWYSDYDGKVSTNATLTVTENPDGTATGVIVAYY